MSAIDATRAESADEKETQRLEAFSDGVFAIAITLLVLEFKVPRDAAARLGRALLADWPSYLGFLTSFATIGIMWINHHRIFGLVQRVDHMLLILNGLLLLGVTFTPYPTAVLASYLGHPGEKVAAAFYSGTFVCIAIAFNLLWRYMSSKRARLMRVAHDHPEVVATHAQYRFGPLFYVVAFAVAFWNATASLALNLAFAAFFAFPPQRAAWRGPAAARSTRGAIE
ncbi:MAG: DUF1211 domain-containing protein [Candidatus Eisenbacteria bacterium]|nr:DUF1211 domain-containing protein [Candidatus Eisenbacteria bacterium]